MAKINTPNTPPVTSIISTVLTYKKAIRKQGRESPIVQRMGAQRETSDVRENISIMLFLSVMHIIGTATTLNTG